MYEEFIRQRISQLRIQKGISEYKLSLDLGHSKGYIQSISSGRALPSMSEFINICEYFDITPYEFFNIETTDIFHLKELIYLVNSMSKEDISLIIQIAKRLNSDKK